MSTIKDALNRFITGVWFFPYLKQAKETDLPEPIGVTKSGKLVKLDPSSAVGPQGPEGPQGEQGPEGPQGPAGTNGTNGTNATITSASATALAEGAAPTVTLGGTASARTFTFGIPKGDKGDTGDTGATGTTGAKGDKGDKGDPGDSIVPTPPETGTVVLKSVDGVLSWVAE